VHFLDTLNPAQRAAATHVEGPMMVIAGAGSGKTRVLTYRMAHLIERGVDPFSILALTFTNKAAREMKERIAQVVGESDARSLWMGTFHSVFARILRTEAERFNYTRNFTIYDTADSRSLLKEIISGLGLDDKVYKPSSIQSRISAAKNNLIDARAYAENDEITGEDKQAGRPRIAEIFRTYEARCFRAQAMDFDDLLFKMNVLLRDFPDLLSKYQHTFRYLLVDEYQDTNFAQYLIVKQLAAVHENICVVGDDAQSIYGFRGANIQNILNFRKDYPDAALYKLEQNYRSTGRIVQAANSVIEKNSDRIPKDLWTANDGGEKIRVHRCATDSEEGRFVATQLFDLSAQRQVPWSACAILYRTNAQSRSFEESLRKLNLPYRIYGGLSFYQRKEVKDLIAYFRLAVNPNDDEALRRVINYPARGIGNTTMDRVVTEAAERDVAIWEVLQGEPPAALRGAAWAKLDAFATLIRSFAAELSRVPAHDLALHIARHTGLVHALHADRSPEGVSRYENIQELLNGVQSYVQSQLELDPEAIPTLDGFLADVALLTDADEDDGDAEKISLMTVHAAKGLEFPHVFVVGLEENLFPSQMAMQSRADLEEERRLFYVALTRACETCTLTYALTRFRWGQITHGDASRFISEIDPSCLDIPAFRDVRTGPASGGWDTARAAWQRPAPAPAPSRTPPPPPPPAHLRRIPAAPAAASRPAPTASGTSLAAGRTVAHERFGRGTVLSIEGAEPNLKATVAFDSAGTKQLLLKFARLTLLDE
jgi:DNA helicase-2/ATP-dependent DNA helicase PcrA